MSAPFLNCRVKITGTSQNELNSQQGVATSYSSETMRYTVLLDSGRTVALKVANLIQVAEPTESSGGGFPGMPAGMDVSQLLNLLPAQLRAKLQRGEMPTLADLTSFLPPGVTVMHVGSAVALFVLMLFKVGIMKTVLLFGILGFVFYAGFGAFSRVGGGVSGLKAASFAIGERLSDLIRQKTRQNIAPHLSLAALAVLLVAVLYSILSSGSGAPMQQPMDFSYDKSYGNSFFESNSILTTADAYDRGYEDAIAGKAQDWSAHASKFAAPRVHTRSPEPTYYQPPVAPRSGFLSGFGIGKMISIAILGRQIYTLGAVPGGGWNIDFAIANLMNMSNIQKGIMFFMVLRVIGMSPI